MTFVWKCSVRALFVGDAPACVPASRGAERPTPKERRMHRIQLSMKQSEFFAISRGIAQGFNAGDGEGDGMVHRSATTKRPDIRRRFRWKDYNGPGQKELYDG